MARHWPGPKRKKQIFFIFCFGGQGHPGRAREPGAKPGKGYPGLPGGSPDFPLGPPGPPWLPLASKKERMGSTFNERRVFLGILTRRIQGDLMRVMKKKEYKQILSRFSEPVFREFG